jgi:hypothetical protein
VRRLGRAIVALLAGALLGGVLEDRGPARRAVTRDGWRVIDADFHVHTRLSDGFLSPFEVVLHARRNGLDALAITEHNVTHPAWMARWFSRLVGGPTILVGEEVTTDRFHLIAIGLRERVSPYGELGAIVDDVHRKGGVAIAAHPVARFWPAFDAVVDKLDGAELMHPLALGPRDGERRGWRWEEMRAFHERAAKRGYPLTPVGSSDYHFFQGLGVTRTVVLARDDSAEAILDAVRAGRTVVRDRDGNPHGNARAIAILAERPIAPGEQVESAADRGYRPKGLVDRSSRIAGWVAMLGVIVLPLGRRRRDVPGETLA